MSLQQKLVEERDKRGFISITKLEELVSLPSVQGFLLTTPTPPASFPELSQKIVHGARKLFAVLVLAELEKSILDVIAVRGITDKFFDASDSDAIPWLESSEEICRFSKERWTIPPILKGEKHLEFPLGIVLPFLEKKCVDHGTFGVVYRVKVAQGHLHGTGLGYAATLDLALKRIEVEDERKWDIVMREVVALSRRSHPNLIPLLASFTECTIESSFKTKYVNMLFPYAEMDMEKWLYLPSAPTLLACQSSAEQRQYLYTAMCDLVSALAALHREVEGLVMSHHDLKPKNVLVIRERLMIADLGMSELVHLGRAGGSEVDGSKGLGTRTYHPPEYYGEDDSEKKRRKMFGRAFDMWAMGCIMVQVAVLIVWGWESGEVERFRKDRLEFILEKADGGDCDRNRLRNDDSFVKCIPVVDDWLARLQQDGSPILQGYLAVAIQMLRGDPWERIYSWEAELNLYDLLHPDEPKAGRIARAVALVQRPPPDKDFIGRETPIHRAAERGNLIWATKMLEVGWPAELKDGNGCTPIELAERNGRLQLRDILRKANAMKELELKSDLTGMIPTATIHAREQSGFRLKQNTSQQGFNPRANSGETEVTLAKPEKPQILKTDRKFGRTILHEAAQSGDIVLLKHFLKQDKANEAVLLTDDFGQTLLHCASKISAEAVSMILEATKHAQRLLMAEDQNGNTPLHLAAARNPGVVDVLLRHCWNTADLRRMLQQENDEGMTPLKVARAEGQAEVEQMLGKALAATIQTAGSI